jgi:hypothetical protein
MWIKQTIGEQRKVLTALFEPVMLKLAKQCIRSWSKPEEIDKLLAQQFATIPHCHLLYAIDKFGRQISANVTIGGIDNNFRGQDLSRRPYSVSLYPKRHFMLSSIYISQVSGRPCISAVQPVMEDQHFLGFIVADFDIRHLPLSVSPSKSQSPVWQQKTDHAVRHVLQQRINSPLDQQVNTVSEVLYHLIQEHGVFHCTLHYASAQAMLWQRDDPYQYRLYSVDQLLFPEMYLAYPRCQYSDKATLSLKQVRQILERFRTLRLADENLYLRSGSLNIMNGMVGLSFSSDGSQYMPAEVFLNKDLAYWFGNDVIDAAHAALSA